MTHHRATVGNGEQQRDERRGASSVMHLYRETDKLVAATVVAGKFVAVRNRDSHNARDVYGFLCALERYARHEFVSNLDAYTAMFGLVYKYQVWGVSHKIDEFVQAFGKYPVAAGISLPYYA